MKKTIRIILSLTFLLSLATISAAANAPVTIYTDQSLFLADTSATQIPFPEDADTALPAKPWSYSDHSCIDNNTGITLEDGDVVIKAPNANNWICFIGPDWNAPPNNTVPLPVNPTIVANGEDDYHVVDLDEPTHSIGFELLTNQIASETITLKFTDDTTHVIFDGDLGTDPNTFEFVGFKSDKLIKSVMIDTSGGAVQNEGISAIWVKENSPPTANPNGPYLGAVNTPISFDGSGSSDPDNDGLTYSWDFGDNNSRAGVKPQYSYALAEIYDVCLTVNDGFVDSDPVCTFAVVFNPSAGFVTGGGWIDSPEGAYDPYPVLPFFDGSYYERLTDPSGVTWYQANEAANASSLEGCASAHLATITSQEEQDAIKAAFWSDLGFSWLGGHREQDQPWQWVTGEPWGYTNWETPPPDENERSVSIGGAGVPGPGGWWIYDGTWLAWVPSGTRPGYIVEYEDCFSGKANFGFVSRYKKGSDVPEGNTEFQFHAADLNFHSSSYEWLVITGSNFAKFKGVGTINGAGEYKFMLWAGDGDPDTFRIRIWEEDGFGVETVIYDNGMDQAIGGGAILIHTK